MSNGPSDASACGEASGSAPEDTERRAEEFVERAGRGVRRPLARAVGRAREEAEDICAETQEERRSGGSPPVRR